MIRPGDESSSRDHGHVAAGSANPRQRAVGVLDIGAAKITCFIAKMNETGRNHIQVVGVGHQSSRGIASGGIVDLEAVESAVRLAIDQAERMAGTSITSVTVNIAAAGMRARKVQGIINMGGREVTDRDVKRCIKTAIAGFNQPEHDVIHAFPQRYRVDENADVRDPRGMFAHELAVEICVVSCPLGPVRNIALAVDRCRLELRAVVATPYAAGLSALVEDERILGATIIDMGAGITSFAIFSEGVLEHLGVVPVGGQHVTNDIARGLNTPKASAERIKTMFGSVLDGPDDDREMIDCPGMCDDPRLQPDQAPRALLTGIIRPRVEETLELVREQLDQVKPGNPWGRRIVLVGGASQLNGMEEIASRVFGEAVRVGKPLGMSGLAEAVAGAGFAAPAGALHHTLLAGQGSIHSTSELIEKRQSLSERVTDNPVHRIWCWLRDNL
ncbi:Cell division protein FtsA [hydrothermal vent metagenome]|uniref:Cell division protein FtsA n=1 Tax=hydrothermal vent metagenome TaxID=652676 RepID=A0A3B0SED6_9ZZZZ